MTDEALFAEAVKARKNAYAPYSDFYVGAALLGESGRVYHGCNVENRAYSPTNCAERTAIFKAISEGERRFSAIAVAGGKRDGALEFCPPCGVCRQVMAEFCDGNFPIVLGTDNGIKRYELRELLAQSF